jgi:hypothetical protein
MYTNLFLHQGAIHSSLGRVALSYTLLICAIFLMIITFEFF